MDALNDTFDGDIFVHAQTGSAWKKEINQYVLLDGDTDSGDNETDVSVTVAADGSFYTSGPDGYDTTEHDCLDTAIEVGVELFHKGQHE